MGHSRSNFGDNPRVAAASATETGWKRSFIIIRRPKKVWNVLCIKFWFSLCWRIFKICKGGCSSSLAQNQTIGHPGAHVERCNMIHGIQHDAPKADKTDRASPNTIHRQNIRNGHVESTVMQSTNEWGNDLSDGWVWPTGFGNCLN